MIITQNNVYSIINIIIYLILYITLYTSIKYKSIYISTNKKNSTGKNRRTITNQTYTNTNKTTTSMHKQHTR